MREEALGLAYGGVSSALDGACGAVTAVGHSQAGVALGNGRKILDLLKSSQTHGGTCSSST